MSSSSDKIFPLISREKVIGVQFGITDPALLRKRSVVEVKNATTYEGTAPAVGGLFDPRMGVLDNNKVCPTDGLGNRDCPGYFGHYELSRPVYNIQFLPYTMKLLRCICHRCGKLLVDKDDPSIKLIGEKPLRTRFQEIYNRSTKIKTCGAENPDGCGAPTCSKLVKEGVATLVTEYKYVDEDNNEQTSTTNLSVEHVYSLFQRIAEEDCLLLGFDYRWVHPSWFVQTVVAVPPPTIRPSVKHDNNQRSEDDITQKLSDIIKTDQTLRQKIEANSSPQVIQEWHNLLQYHVATMIDNDLPGVAPSAHRLGRALKSIVQRIVGKEGRIRNNLMGKRVEFSARSVITGDPNLSINELGVPVKIAKNLTVPETVTSNNIHRLQSFIINGPDKYPGAKSIILKKDGNLYSLKILSRKNIRLSIGDIVNRHLMDGDPVIFNRQPTLHRPSMMCHLVKVLPYNTFRINITVTPPYNADCDGDEMNMHVPQSIETMTELKQLALVSKQIVSPKNNSPIIKTVQDSVLGINRFTSGKFLLNRMNLMNILMGVKHFDGRLPEPVGKDAFGNPYWNGWSVLGKMLPSVFMEMKNSNQEDGGNSENDIVKIQGGKRGSGTIDKAILTKGTKGLIHKIFLHFGHETSRDFLDNLQNVVINFLMKSGFSVGLSDLIADKETENQIKKVIDDKKRQVAEIMTALHTATFDNNTAQTNQQLFESRANQILNNANSEAGKIGRRSLSADNRMTNMVKAGSKGSNLNISQMVACLGQVNVDGTRIPYGFTGRTLPHFQRYDDSPTARGFVENSFVRGLTPTEFFFHAMSGREGLIDTAVKTSSTGQIQRQMIKAMEDLKVHYDRSVRNANGTIVQTLQGDDGVDAMMVISQPLPTLKMSCLEIHSKFSLSKDENQMNQMHPNTARESRNSADMIEQETTKLNELMIDDRDNLLQSVGEKIGQVNYPINFEMIITQSVHAAGIDKANPTDLTPMEVFEEIHNLIEQTQIGTVNGNRLFIALVRYYLHPVNIIKKHRCSSVIFKQICDEIKLRFDQALVNPGEMVGVIAAQSIGEPATQLTLNTFHFSGIAEKSNVTRGVPRLNEILHLSKNLKNPSLTVQLDERYRDDRESADKIRSSLIHTKLRDLTEEMKIYFDPDDSQTDEDEVFMRFYNTNKSMFHDVTDTTTSPWVLRIKLDRAAMLDRGTTMEDVDIAIQKMFADKVSVQFSDTNSEDLVFRLRLKTSSEITSDQHADALRLLKEMEVMLLDKVVIGGIPGIEYCTIRNTRGSLVKRNHEFEEIDELVLDTVGTNLIDVMGIQGIDFRRLYSNNIIEVYEVLGIDAARNVILKEIQEVIDFGGEYVNHRHLTLLVDVMTNRGKLMSIDRHGVNKSEAGPLAKASFEETDSILTKAGVMSEIDPVTGVTANIMFGQPILGGTNMSQILLDENLMMLTRKKRMEKEERKDEEEIDERSRQMCSVENIETQTGMGEKVKQMVDLDAIDEDEDIVIRD